MQYSVYIRLYTVSSLWTDVVRENLFVHVNTYGIPDIDFASPDLYLHRFIQASRTDGEFMWRVATARENAASLQIR